MTFERLEEILNETKRIHRSSIPRIDFSLNDKKHAIYLIQGGVITSVTNALTFNIGGYYVPTSQQKRLIDEAIDLIWFFDENDEQARQLKAWFEGHVVEREPGNTGNLTLDQRAEKNFLSKEAIDEMQTLQKKLSNLTSKVMHPTIQAMQASSSKSTHIFDYDNQIPKKPVYNEEYFGNMYVLPALYALLIPARNLLLPESEFNLLRSYVPELS